MDKLNDVLKWFRSQCDGDWEHENCVRIFTTDNPGWGMQIDISRTHLEGIVVNYRESADELDWMEVSSDGKVIVGFGGVNNLTAMLSFFLEEILPHARSEFVYEIYAKIKGISVPVWRKLEAELVNGGEFVIKSIPNVDFLDLRFESFEDATKIKGEDLNFIVEYEVGDRVFCDLKCFEDGVENVVLGMCR